MSEIQNSPKRHRRGLRRTVIVAVVITGVIVAGTAAYAVWTAHSNAKGTVTTATVQSPAQTVSSTGAMVIGGCVDEYVTVNNPNPFALKVTSVTHDGWSDSTDPAPSEHGNASRLEDFLDSNITASDVVGKTVPANGSRTFTLNNAACLRNTADDARQGKSAKDSITLTYDVVPANTDPFNE